MLMFYQHNVIEIQKPILAVPGGHYFEHQFSYTLLQKESMII